LPSGDVRLDVQPAVALSPHTTLGVGGAARWFMRAESIDDVVAAHRWSIDRGIDMFVLGGGSNIVTADSGIDGLVVSLALSGIASATDGGDTLLTVSAGEPWDSVVRASIARGLAGLECLSGIPGTAGATPIQNVGAYGQEVAETIDRVTVYDRLASRTRILGREECGFAYRMSRFKRDDKDRFIVCDVTFRLRAGSSTVTYPDIIDYLDRAGITSPSIHDVRQAVLAVRRRKGMVLDSTDPDTRSVGSFFMNPMVSAADRERVASVAGVPAPGFALADGRVKIPAAWLIEHAGFQRGDADGPVGISTKHTLALVNRGGATARDVLRLATRIKRRVSDRFGVLLRPEPVFAGFDNDPEVEYLVGGP
jgi:UDP-N-acetylmuramate dehydrogenase